MVLYLKSGVLAHNEPLYLPREIHPSALPPPKFVAKNSSESSNNFLKQWKRKPHLNVQPFRAGSFAK